ncbi:hypothetical protein [Clostridium sp. JS66]|uniref:hypothetical protein n=1 Tax=Clostridium sp. JS66 TaxID=3064705 RepID=UPI00298EB16F|nr:hypothetical protein [Clostridium sp. JS66]WPC42537.1 hypothetical protein Q6H37_03465 [Clostridium sp. JS66]
MKSRKTIGIMLLCMPIRGPTGIVANAAGVDSNIITKPAIVNAISTRDVTDKEFNDVVGEVQKEQNLPIVKDLMKRAKNYLANGFYVEMKVTCEGGAKESGIVKKY